MTLILLSRGITFGTKKYIGEERLQQMNPWGDLARSGAIIGFGADWPVANPDSFRSIQNSVTRIDPENPGRGTLGENQEISVEKAVEMLTINGAWLHNLDEVTGSIESGKYGDFYS